MILVGTGEKKDKSSVPYKLIQGSLGPGDRLEFINYPASIGPANSTPNPVDWTQGLAQSLTEGEYSLTRAVMATHDVPVLVGYSLGAYVVSNYLENRAKKSRFNEEIKQAILIANPRAKLNRGRAGICNPHGDFGKVKVTEVTNWNDMIASVPINSVLKKSPYFVDFVTGGLRNKTVLFDAIARNNGFPTVNDFFQLIGYIDQSEHVHAYFEAMFVNQIKNALAS